MIRCACSIDFMLINANSRCTNRTFRQVNLYQNNLYGVHLRDCVFIGGDMDEVNLESAHLENVIFEGCMMCDANFKHATLINVEFYDVILFRGDFSFSKSAQCHFYGVDMGDTKFINATLTDVSFLKDNLLHQTNMNAANFAGAIFDNVIL